MSLNIYLYSQPLLITIIKTLTYEKYKRNSNRKNLMKSFAGESQARMRYTYFAREADKEGFKQLQLFLWKPPSKKEHAKRMFKYLEGGMLEITSTFLAWSYRNNSRKLKSCC